MSNTVNNWTPYLCPIPKLGLKNYALKKLLRGFLLLGVLWDLFSGNDKE